jgi:regulator of RNase E activity RraA
MGATDTLVRRYREFDTSLVSDTLDTFGIDGVITGLSPSKPGFSTVGRARPMRFERVEDADGSTNFPYAMLERFAPGVVFVIDGPSPDISCWGVNASRLAANAGLAGVVVDGGYRDVDEIREGSFPVFAGQPTPRTGQGRVRVAGIDEPITVRGVEVTPDDIVVADGTGVVVVPTDLADEVAASVAEKSDEERRIVAKIERGTTVAELRDDEHEF